MASNPSKRQRSKLVFEAWRASLADRDRSHTKLIENFDDLFYEMDRYHIDFDLAHEYLDLAIAAHLPDKKTLRYTYKKTGGFGMDEAEFHEKWKDKIRDAATNVFYTRFPLEDEEAKEEANHGGMSREESLRQRRYSNSFPTLDLSLIPDPEDLVDDDDVAFSINDLEM